MTARAEADSHDFPGSEGRRRVRVVVGGTRLQPVEQWRGLISDTAGGRSSGWTVRTTLCPSVKCKEARRRQREHGRGGGRGGDEHAGREKESSLQKREARPTRLLRSERGGGVIGRRRFGQLCGSVGHLRIKRFIIVRGGGGADAGSSKTILNPQPTAVHVLAVGVGASDTRDTTAPILSEEQTKGVVRDRPDGEHSASAGERLGRVGKGCVQHLVGNVVELAALQHTVAVAFGGAGGVRLLVVGLEKRDSRQRVGDDDAGIAVGEESAQPGGDGSLDLAPGCVVGPSISSQNKIVCNIESGTHLNRSGPP